MPYIDLGGGLELKTFEVEHADALFAAVDSCRKYLREWLPWVDATRSPRDSLAFIERARRQDESNNGFQVGIWFQGHLVGCMGFHAFDAANRRTSLGYWVRQDFQGRGIVTRSCRALVRHALVDLKMHRLEIRCGVQNTRSRAICEALGLRFEGVARECEWLYDHFIDHAVYAALESEWLRSQGSREP